ncbi:MAG TPA: hypothetical protein VG820_13220 [Fimbriimonadaceae bacterium]|nr:hypothetical protein [Fimbriimonadaceae bacterium]
MRRFLLIVAGMAASAIALALYLQSSSLYVNGNLASSGVVERNGTAYVPIKDVAKALNLSLQKTARGYELSDSGGANQVEGITGKVGDVLWNGFARFTVVKVIRGKEYTNQFSGDNQKVTPYPEANDLVVLVCRIKNGTKEKQTCMLPAGDATGLADTDGHSYAPRNGLSIDCPSRGQELLPGAAVDFALTFDVPPSAKLQDLVYEVNFFATKSGQKKFRVSLQQP